MMNWITGVAASARFSSKAVAAAALTVAVAAVAREYYFHVSAAGPAFAQTTIETDRTNGWLAAQRIAATYLNYSAFSALFATWDRVQVSYHDGQIARFEVMCVACSARLRFDSQHSAPVPGSKALSTIGGSGSGGNGEWSHASLFRDDYQLNLQWIMLLETLTWLRPGTVEIIQSPIFNNGGFCYNSSFCDASN